MSLIYFLFCLLQPENVFLNSEYCAKIGDFGLATLIDGIGADEPAGASNHFQRNLTRHCGTYLYMAPELASGIYITLKLTCTALASSLSKCVINLSRLKERELKR